MGNNNSCNKSSLKWKNFHVTKDILGNGGFATIRRGVYGPKKKEFAIKIINIDMCLNRTNGLEMLRTEYESLKILSSTHSTSTSTSTGGGHVGLGGSTNNSTTTTNSISSTNPFITLLHYAYSDYINCYLVFDVLSGGDLRYYISTRQCFRENQVAFIIACVSCALEYIHFKGILHRDVKPDNIVFTSSGYPKLTDFGVACVCEDSSLSCSYASGTLSYLAPEVLTASHVHGKGSDYWSLGVVMYELLYLCKPWRTHCPKDFVRYIESYYAGEKSIKRVNSLTTLDRGSRDSDDIYSFRSYAASVSTNSHHSAAGDLLSQYTPAETDMPSSLVVPLNEYTAYGQYISAECLSLLSGLLDVRLDKRLGSSLTGISHFMKHAWWKLTQIPLDDMMMCSRDEELSNVIRSPIRIDVNTVQETIKWSNTINSRKPEAFIPGIDSSNSSSPHHSSNGFFESFSLLSRRMLAYSKRSPPSSPHAPNQVLPLNYSNEVMYVLDNYQYVGPSLTS